MNYLQELESKLHPDFISMESNIEYKKYYPISYMKMLEEICHHYGWNIEGNRSLKKHTETVEDEIIDTSVGTINRRYDFNTLSPSVWVQDSYKRWFKWTVYGETEDGYYIRHLDAVTMVNKKEIYTEVKNGIEFTKTNRLINVPITCMRFNLTCLSETDNVDYEHGRQWEMLLRGMAPGMQPTPKKVKENTASEKE